MMRMIIGKARRIAQTMGPGLMLAAIAAGGALASPERLSDQQMAWITAGSLSVLLGFADGRVDVSLDGTALKITGATSRAHSLSVTVDGRTVNLSGTTFNYAATVSSPTDSVVVTSGTPSPSVGANSGAIVISTDSAATISSVSQGATSSTSGRTVISTIGPASGVSVQNVMRSVSSMMSNLNIGVSVGR